MESSCTQSKPPILDISKKEISTFSLKFKSVQVEISAPCNRKSCNWQINFTLPVNCFVCRMSSQTSRKKKDKKGWLTCFFDCSCFIYFSFCCFCKGHVRNSPTEFHMVPIFWSFWSKKKKKSILWMAPGYCGSRE